jgi:hypothetical protein
MYQEKQRHHRAQEAYLKIAEEENAGAARFLQ